MAYILNTPEDRKEMLAAIGVASVDELFSHIPAELRFRGELKIPPALGEMELTAHLAELAGRNVAAGQKVCFLGAGCYDHFVPAVVDYVAGRGEFYTSYTPYQPEASQGNLQAFFEYQTLITQLTGMDVSNASLYDGGSAAAEGVLLCLAAGGERRKVVVSAGVHPEYRQTIATYLTDLDAPLATVAAPTGVTAPADLARAIGDNTACVLIQQPNFFGCLEDVEALTRAAHERGAMVVVAVDPISLGMLRRPGDYGADVVVAEGQSLGTPMQFGGPFLGIMACRERFVRRMPGRIAGQTVDRRGKRCWVLTLQTREQHIRREKATSNICTNQGLFALRAAVYLAAQGPQGLRETAESCLRKSHYARGKLTTGGRLAAAFDTPTFKEFVVRDAKQSVNSLLTDALAAGYFAGVPLGRWYPELADCFLVTVTERRTRAEIDGLAAALSQKK